MSIRDDWLRNSCTSFIPLPSWPTFLPQDRHSISLIPSSLFSLPSPSMLASHPDVFFFSIFFYSLYLHPILFPPSSCCLLKTHFVSYSVRCNLRRDNTVQGYFCEKVYLDGFDYACVSVSKLKKNKKNKSRIHTIEARRCERDCIVHRKEERVIALATM